MHTTEQAKELWCPMVRIARREHVTPVALQGDPQASEAVVVAGCNTDALGSTRVPASCRCISDKCAMWRWEGPEPPVERTNASVMARANRRGYCGLVGQPEVV